MGLLQAIIVSCCGCFHGRTLAVISMSCDNDATRGFGPLLPGNLKVDFGDADSLEKVFKGNEHVLPENLRFELELIMCGSCRKGR